MISASIFFVTSGSAGQPSGVENLMPLYSGGLCDAVKLMTPSALCVHHSISKRRSRRGFGDDQRRDAVRRQDFRRHRAKCFAQESRIAPDNDARTLRLLRSYVAGNSAHRALHVGEGEFLRHHGAPSGCAKFDLVGMFDLSCPLTKC